MASTTLPPLDSNAATGMWHIRANTGDNQYRMWDFHVEDFMPERMALNLTGEKTPLTPKDEVKFSVVGTTCMVRLLMVIFCKGNFSCAHCVKLCQPYRF